MLFWRLLFCLLPLWPFFSQYFQASTIGAFMTGTSIFFTTAPQGFRCCRLASFRFGRLTTAGATCFLPILRVHSFRLFSSRCCCSALWWGLRWRCCFTFPWVCLGCLWQRGALAAVALHPCLLPLFSCSAAGLQPGLRSAIRPFSRLRFFLLFSFFTSTLRLQAS